MDYAAAFFEILGLWLIGSRNKWGFVSFIVGGVFWTYTGIVSGIYGLVLVCIVTICINCINIKRWSIK